MVRGLGSLSELKLLATGFVRDRDKLAMTAKEKSNTVRLMVLRIKWPLGSARPRNLQNRNFSGMTRFGLQSSVGDHRVEQKAAVSSV
ncbi:hypothetical protein NL676_022777 [Syzygium grande]|nr:hypothetical protein NL676_022777 [Syzygium grande]